MICMEEDGMKKVLFEIVVPAVVLALWMITCYPVCCKAEGFDYFLYWILVGCPLDTMSKGIKGQQKRHCRLIIHNNTFICHPEHIP